MTEQLGARAGQTNSRAIVNVGPVQSLDPVVVRKRQHRLDGVDTVALWPGRQALTTGEVLAQSEEIYGASLSENNVFEQQSSTESVVGPQ